jgi:TM2 domain-containing membrane protein YozV
MEEKNIKISKKSRLVAFLLCYVFGICGAHRFYVEKTYSGIAFIMGLIVSGVLLGVIKDGMLSIVLAVIILSAIIIVWAVDTLMIILGKFKTPKGYVLKNWITED